VASWFRPLLMLAGPAMAQDSLDRIPEGQETEDRLYPGAAWRHQGFLRRGQVGAAFLCSMRSRSVAQADESPSRYISSRTGWATFPAGLQLPAMFGRLRSPARSRTIGRAVCGRFHPTRCNILGYSAVVKASERTLQDACRHGTSRGIKIAPRPGGGRTRIRQGKFFKKAELVAPLHHQPQRRPLSRSPPGRAGRRYRGRLGRLHRYAEGAIPK